MRDKKGRFVKGSQKPKNAYSWGTREENPRWKGGVLLNHSGYILRSMKTHPNCDIRGYVFEHRLIMEKHLGRTLKESEVVHHINGDKTDNNIENLMLFSSHSEHMRHESFERIRNKKGQFKGRK